MRKGVLIDSLKSKLILYPLTHKLFEAAYNPKIRNIIGHNNYKIVDETIVSLEDETITISKFDIFKAIYSIQSLNNYLLNYLSCKSIPIANLQNAGILGMAFGLEGKHPVLSIFQLSCFYQIGNFRWAKKIQFSISDNQVETNFGFQVPMIGPFSKELEQIWFKPLRDEKELRVYLTPIIPRNEQINFITLDVGDFVVLEDRKPIDLEYEIIVMRHN